MDLRTARENSGMSPTQVAGAANVSVSFLYKAEEGKEPVRRSLVVRICNVLSVKIEDIEGLNLK